MQTYQGTALNDQRKPAPMPASCEVCGAPLLLDEDTGGMCVGCFRRWIESPERRALLVTQDLDADEYVEAFAKRMGFRGTPCAS